MVIAELCLEHTSKLYRNKLSKLITSDAAAEGVGG